MSGDSEYLVDKDGNSVSDHIYQSQTNIDLPEHHKEFKITKEDVEKAKALAQKLRDQHNESMAEALMKAGFTLIRLPFLERFQIAVSQELSEAAQRVLERREKANDEEE